MRIAVITFSTQGSIIARQIKAGLGKDVKLYFHSKLPVERGVKRFDKVADLTAEIFGNFKGLIYVGPTGVVVRAVSGCLRHKLTDPAVVVVDAGGHFVVSLVCGHEGGANALALLVANVIGAEPVVSTTTEAVKDVIVGVGCRRGAAAGAITRAVRAGLKKAGVSVSRVRWVATAEIKRNEKGLNEAVERLGLSLRIVPDWQIKRFGEGVAVSEFVKSKTGLPSVAEAAAVTSGRATELILKRQVIGGVTVAVARENCLSLE